MHRNSLRALLHGYNPTDSDEIAFKARTLAFVEQQVDCFERSLAIGHITASVWLVNHDNSKALLLHHTKLNAWFQLGGHCDGDSDVVAVALKEAQEESGIEQIEVVDAQIFDLDVHRIPANSREQEHDHYDVRFLLRVTGDYDVVQNRESKELRWIDKNRASLPTQNRSVVRMFDKWIQ